MTVCVEGEVSKKVVRFKIETFASYNGIIPLHCVFVGTTTYLIANRTVNMESSVAHKRFLPHRANDSIEFRTNA